MGQVTIYLEDEIERKMRSAAKSMHMPQSKWIAGVIREKLIDEWPDSVRELAGAWTDFPPLDEIRGSQVPDVTREVL
jgi:hypothetical protein